MPFRRSSVPLAGVILMGVSLVWAATATAQVSGERYDPLDHRQQPGVAGRWATLTKPDFPGYLQPVRIALPTTGQVTFYAGSPTSEVPRPAPAHAKMAPGRVYRVRISGMPEFPGVELFPTIEMIDRLHAPEGLGDQFPVPIEMTTDEIELALQERMVTKVIYLEQPDLAAPFPQANGIRTEDLSPRTNLLEAADQRGRPIAILRIGGRIPDPNSPVDEFYSSSPVVVARTGDYSPPPARQ